MRLRRQVRRLEEEALRLEWEAWLRTLSPKRCDTFVGMGEIGLNLFRLPLTEEAAARAQRVEAEREPWEWESGAAAPDHLTEAECYYELGVILLSHLREGEIPRRFAHPNAEARLIAWVRKLIERPDLTLAELEACL